MIHQITLLSLLPVAFGHMAMWHPSTFDFNGDGYSAAQPLLDMTFKQWWFHGNLSPEKISPNEVFNLPAGETVTVNLACERRFTDFSNNPSLVTGHPCPTDPGALHAGTGEDQLLGCGLAIAYKDDPFSVQPEDFVIFSVNTECVKTMRTTFDVPANMPNCKNGKCTCAWFFQGQTSFDEMYMTGFTCNIIGGSDSTSLGTPRVPVYCGDGSAPCVDGPKNPMYWGQGNERSNTKSPGYEKKPAYNPSWGFKNGAQNDIFGQGSNTDMSKEPKDIPMEAESNSFENTTTTTTTTTKPKANPNDEVEPCVWKGHCNGDPCKTYNDCDGSLICINRKCAPKPNRLVKKDNSS